MEILENNRALALRVAAGGVAAAFISLGYYRLRKWVAGNACTSQTDLTGKTVVITGGNAGLGLETALNLAGRNAHVILACRSVERGEKAAVFVRRRTGNQNVIFMKLDLASLKSVRLFSEALHKQESCVDILINNAGVSYSSYQQTEDGFEAHMGVNHLGHFLLTNLLLDLLKNSPSARVVNVTSSLYKNCPKFEFDKMNDNSPSRYSIGIPGRAYSMSKLANILFTRSLAKHLEGSNVSVYVVGPGLVNTNLKRNTPALIRVPFAHVAWFLVKTPKQGAQTIIHCAVAKELEGISGRYYRNCNEAEYVTAVATDDKTAKKLWEVSSQMVGLEK